MNSLSPTRITSLTRAVSPLVVDVGHGMYAWIQNGHGFTLNTRGSAQWVPMVDCVGIGGHVLTASQVTALVAAYGKPVLP
jgi:hypothetical protein